ncbi:MAG: hypothetical protein V3S11_05650 [Elusimicrobiota bacterium]
MNPIVEEPLCGDLIDAECLREYRDDIRHAIRGVWDDTRCLESHGGGAEYLRRIKLFAHQTAGSAGTYGFHGASQYARSLDALAAELISGRHRVNGAATGRIMVLLRALEREIGLRPSI